MLLHPGDQPLVSSAALARRRPAGICTAPCPKLFCQVVQLPGRPQRCTCQARMPGESPTLWAILRGPKEGILGPGETTPGSSAQPTSSRRTPKRFKADRGHQGKAQLQRVSRKSPGTPRVPPKARCSSEHRDLPKAGNGAAAEATDLFPELGVESQACSGEQNTTEQGTQPPLVHLDPDPDVFLDDSSQPLPVSCFFGNVELMQVCRGLLLSPKGHEVCCRIPLTASIPQDLPPASSACPSMSRREFRKLHFRAKDDDDEEDDDAAEM